jgi:hypothetical protein
VDRCGADGTCKKLDDLVVGSMPIDQGGHKLDGATGEEPIGRLSDEEDSD